MPKASADFIVKSTPAIGWGAKLKPKSEDSHKYDHGHVVVLGSRKLTGAGCLAGDFCAADGGWSCTVAAPPETSIIYRLASPSLMVESCDEIARFKDHIQDARRNVAIVGPGAGLDNVGGLKKAVLDAVQSNPQKNLRA